ncbi:MAG: hypothetical protein WBA16_00395 [Nonlabens sp.]
MRSYYLHFVLYTAVILFLSCENKKTGTDLPVAGDAVPTIAGIKEENYDVSRDSVTLSSGTIENFDAQGNSVDVYWIGADRDTTLRFYRKYDQDKRLIGAEYFEAGDLEPSRDTVYYNDQGQKVEASLDAAGKITWKATQLLDENGNKVLTSYQNGAGEYRGLDSLYYDNNNRVIRGFYENSKGKRYSIKTYKYLATDQYGNWTERQMFKNDTLAQKQIRIIAYAD